MIQASDLPSFQPFLPLILKRLRCLRSCSPTPHGCMYPLEAQLSDTTGGCAGCDVAFHAIPVSLHPPSSTNHMTRTFHHQPHYSLLITTQTLHTEASNNFAHGMRQAGPGLTPLARHVGETSCTAPSLRPYVPYVPYVTMPQAPWAPWRHHVAFSLCTEAGRLGYAGLCWAGGS